jgi:hypothetical protein
MTIWISNVTMFTVVYKVTILPVVIVLTCISWLLTFLMTFWLQ